MNLYSNEPVYVSVNKYKKVKIEHLKSFSLIAFAISVISYFFIIYQAPVFPYSANTVTLFIYQKAPLTLSILCFALTVGFLLYGLNVVAKKRRLSVWQSLIVAFVFINPFTLKAILTPVDNVSYALCVFLTYRLYLLFQKETKDSRYVTFILLLACSLFFKNGLFVFAQIAVMDFIYHVFTSSSDKNKSSIQTLSLIGIVGIISAFFYNTTLDTISDHISFFLTTFIALLNSVWVAFLMIGLIGFIGWVSSILKTSSIKLSLIAPLAFLMIFACYMPEEKTFNMPFLMAMLIFSFSRIVNISKAYGIVLASALVILTSSAYFTVLNNHRIQSIFVESLTQSIRKDLIKDQFYSLLGDMPASPVVKPNNLYPTLFWNSFYFNIRAWADDQKQQGFIFIIGPQQSIKNLGMDYYLKKPINDTKYYRIVNKDDVNYVILNGKDR